MKIFERSCSKARISEFLCSEAEISEHLCSEKRKISEHRLLDAYPRREKEFLSVRHATYRSNFKRIDEQ